MTNSQKPIAFFRPLRLIIFSVLAGFLLVRFLLMPQMGSYLVLKHELRPAGAIVLLLVSTPVETNACAYTLRHGERSASDCEASR